MARGGNGKLRMQRGYVLRDFELDARETVQSKVKTTVLNRDTKSCFEFVLVGFPLIQFRNAKNMDSKSRLPTHEFPT
jgi:hypothetical protein